MPSCSTSAGFVGDVVVGEGEGSLEEVTAEDLRGLDGHVLGSGECFDDVAGGRGA